MSPLDTTPVLSLSLTFFLSPQRNKINKGSPPADESHGERNRRPWLRMLKPKRSLVRCCIESHRKFAGDGNDRLIIHLTLRIGHHRINIVSRFAARFIYCPLVQRQDS